MTAYELKPTPTSYGRISSERTCAKDVWYVKEMLRNWRVEVRRFSTCRFTWVVFLNAKQWRKKVVSTAAWSWWRYPQIVWSRDHTFLSPVVRVIVCLRVMNNLGRRWWEWSHTINLAQLFNNIIPRHFTNYENVRGCSSCHHITSKTWIHHHFRVLHKMT